ncbi:S-methyl-5-thioribose-1-phosphate isomerase [Paenibacillus polymyxa]|uniref:Methylthioribose-1-phosphate isomerase n=1 Tax=Paenibacillus polymyxa (strain SC2) TaxID=886882 RepID=E3EIM4_PAEPS|nr:S-methyl-5-thioribose-1-phosphate isomerase [Paenibacillus polymyxa]ADO55662.1 methylthioribose-1-phosphate isomerase [Paenibacillus polymyxa SC2]WPQ58406.1 S-methyl-5-thioribose-1-phosphate isomerase [Paenibacillus polymyxa]CCC84448.1 translation initiation factor, putative, aIF-2BI family [Paenibacillus polymyxa M1]
MSENKKWTPASSREASATGQPLSSLVWKGNHLSMLDQRLLPETIVMLDLFTTEEVWEGIHAMKVRGAPAIGMAAAYGVVLGAISYRGNDAAGWLEHVHAVCGHLATSRPTAVNLFWALDRMKKRACELVTEAEVSQIEDWNAGLEREAIAIQAEDEEVCRQIGIHALPLFEDGMGVLTHCNAGGLATAKYGTALAPLYLAQENGIHLKVFADETRPVLQGARLTAFELQQAGIDVTLLCDNMAGMVMSKGWVQAVIVGTDRVAANGDVANKIGTYSLAVLAKAHGIPFYVASPLSTIDLQTATGADIPIEERSAEEVTESFGKRTAPEGIKVYNPAFDVTPHKYITAIITEKGIVQAPFSENLTALFAD